MTSAPRRARCWVQDGPARTCEKSSTRTPAKALVILVASPDSAPSRVTILAEFGSHRDPADTPIHDPVDFASRENADFSDEHDPRRGAFRMQQHRPELASRGRRQAGIEAGALAAPSSRTDLWHGRASEQADRLRSVDEAGRSADQTSSCGSRNDRLPRGAGLRRAVPAGGWGPRGTAAL